MAILENAHGATGQLAGIERRFGLEIAPPADAVWRDAWNVSESLLARINDEVAARGARFVVTTITMAEQVHPDEGVRRGLEIRPGIQDMLYPDRRISEIGRKYGFAVVVLAERMRQIASQEGVFFHGFENTVMGQGHMGWHDADCGQELLDTVHGGRYLGHKCCAHNLDFRFAPRCSCASVSVS